MKGAVQTLQNSAATFAGESPGCEPLLLQCGGLVPSSSTMTGMVTVFCNRLGWMNFELLFAQFQVC